MYAQRGNAHGNLQLPAPHADQTTAAMEVVGAGSKALPMQQGAAGGAGTQPGYESAAVVAPSMPQLQPVMMDSAPDYGEAGIAATGLPSGQGLTGRVRDTERLNR